MSKTKEQKYIDKYLENTGVGREVMKSDDTEKARLIKQVSVDRECIDLLVGELQNLNINILDLKNYLNGATFGTSSETLALIKGMAQSKAVMQALTPKETTDIIVQLASQYKSFALQGLKALLHSSHLLLTPRVAFDVLKEAHRLVPQAVTILLDNEGFKNQFAIACSNFASEVQALWNSNAVIPSQCLKVKDFKENLLKAGLAQRGADSAGSFLQSLSSSEDKIAFESLSGMPYPVLEEVLKGAGENSPVINKVVSYLGSLDIKEFSKAIQGLREGELTLLVAQSQVKDLFKGKLDEYFSDGSLSKSEAIAVYTIIKALLKGEYGTSKGLLTDLFSGHKEALKNSPKLEDDVNKLFSDLVLAKEFDAVKLLFTFLPAGFLTKTVMDNFAPILSSSCFLSVDPEVNDKYNEYRGGGVPSSAVSIGNRCALGNLDDSFTFTPCTDFSIENVQPIAPSAPIYVQAPPAPVSVSYSGGFWAAIGVAGGAFGFCAFEVVQALSLPIPALEGAVNGHRTAGYIDRHTKAQAAYGVEKGAYLFKAAVACVAGLASTVTGFAQPYSISVVAPEATIPPLPVANPLASEKHSGQQGGSDHGLHQLPQPPKDVAAAGQGADNEGGDL